MATEITERESRQVAEEARETEWRLPSFGKELFLGNLRLDLIHPQPPLDPQEVEKGERFLAQLREFLEREVDPMQIEREAKIPDHVLDGLKRLGALGMKIPEEQKRKWLPLVARTHISAFLLTEPDVGSDPARMAATATPTEDGSGYILNGRKLWATNGVIADVVVVMAKVPKSEGHRGGISAFILPYDSEGVTVERRNQFTGLRGIGNSVTRLENVFVPAENRIGQEGQGLRIALTTLNTGRLALPAICVGVAKWATKVGREWSLERVQWGAPIGKHDAIAQKLAFIAATAFGLEALLDVAARLAD